jgi:hypothetical protein
MLNVRSFGTLKSAEKIYEDHILSIAIGIPKVVREKSRAGVAPKKT